MKCDLVKKQLLARRVCSLSGSRITLAPRPTPANHVKGLLFFWLRTGLLPLYCDENNDLVADVPTDPEKLRDPSTLAFVHTPVEHPSVYQNVFKPCTDFWSYGSKVPFKEPSFGGFFSGLGAGGLSGRFNPKMSGTRLTVCAFIKTARKRGRKCGSPLPSYACLRRNDLVAWR
jgi:hypothetical protein